RKLPPLKICFASSTAGMIFLSAICNKRVNYARVVSLLLAALSRADRDKLPQSESDRVRLFFVCSTAGSDHSRTKLFLERFSSEMLLELSRPTHSSFWCRPGIVDNADRE